MLKISSAGLIYKLQGQPFPYSTKQFGNYTAYGIMLITNPKDFDAIYNDFIGSDKVSIRLEINQQPVTLTFVPTTENQQKFQKKEDTLRWDLSNIIKDRDSKIALMMGAYYEKMGSEEASRPLNKIYAIASTRKEGSEIVYWIDQIRQKAEQNMSSDPKLQQLVNDRGFYKENVNLLNQTAQRLESNFTPLRENIEQDVAEDTGSWIVYDPETRQIKKRFKTHTAGKSYAQTHKLGFASSEYYFDRVKEKAVAESKTDYQKRRQRERDVDAGKPVARQPKNPQTDYARKRAQQKKEMELGEMDKSQKGPAGWNIDDYDYSKGKWTQGKIVKTKDAVKDMSKELNKAFNSPKPNAKKPVKESYWTKLQNERNTKVTKLVDELKASIK